MKEIEDLLNKAKELAEEDCPFYEDNSKMWTHEMYQRIINGIEMALFAVDELNR